MMEDTIPPNLKDLVQLSSQNGAPDNIDLNNTWFTPYIEEYTRKNPTQLPRVALENNGNTITSSKPVQQVQESPISKGVLGYEVIECPVSEGFQNT